MFDHTPDIRLIVTDMDGTSAATHAVGKSLFLDTRYGFLNLKFPLAYQDAVQSSDISRINGLDRGQETAVHLDTFDCLRTALEVQRETDGAFDVAYGSCGPWSARPRFELDEAGHTVRVLEDGVCLDLGGIGKGFALDRLAALLADDIPDGARRLSASFPLPDTLLAERPSLGGL